MSVRLSTNSWHFKLQQFVFGDAQKVRNFCGYFWKTVASAALVLPASVIIVVMSAFDTVKRGFLNRIAEPISWKLTQRAVNKMTDADIFKCMWFMENRETNSQISWKLFWQASDILNSWKQLTPDWQEHVKRIKGLFGAHEVLVPETRDWSGIGNKIWNGIAIAYFGSAILALLVGSIIAVANGHLIALATAWGVVFSIVGSLFGIVVAKDHGKLDRPVELLSTPFAFLRAGFRAYKQKNCPLVEWVD